jgi:altronate hydrolase
VLVALRDLTPGTVVEYGAKRVVLKELIPAKHKFTMESMQAGDEVYMYGVLVGRMSRALSAGALITRENTVHASGHASVRNRSYQWEAPDISRFVSRTFRGYHRPDGRVGTANHWIVVPLVYCENRNIEILKDALTGRLGYDRGGSYRHKAGLLVEKFLSGRSAAEIGRTDLSEGVIASYQQERVFKNIDGIKFLTHQMGCCSPRSDSDTLCGLIAGYITHPNVAGATILSLGCQNAQIHMLEEAIRMRDPHLKKPLVILEQQKIGTERVLMDEALKRTFAGLMEANEIERQPAPISRISMGLECGGSDGFSGISCNPALGYASDLLVACGGASILSEFPELCGVEQELSDRCETREAAEKFLNLMKRYNARAEQDGSGFYANPTEGNIRDGLITDAIKSAGAARKGGTAPIADVLDYPERQVKPGLHLLCTPGGDIESVTAEVGAGANVVVFTTGMGTPTGNAIAPTIKLSSNTALYQKMPDIIDQNCGEIVEGKKTIEQQGEEILNLVIRVAGGDLVPKAVALGQDDFMPWKRGISL